MDVGLPARNISGVRSLFARRPPEPVEEDRALTRSNTPAIMLPTTLAGPPVSPRSALAIPDAWACVRTLAHAAASLPLHCYRRTDAGRERADTTLAARLFRRPAPGVTQSALIGHVMTSLALWGETFVALYRNGEGTIEQLGIFAPDRVTVDARGGLPLYGVTTDDGRYLVLDSQHVIHVRGPMTLDGVRGVSPISQVREAFGYAGALVEYGASVMENGARPSGVLYVQPGVHADEQVENLRAAWEARHRGSLNAGRVALLTGEVKFEQISMSMEDAQFLAQADFSTAQVCRIFGVPPFMVGAKTGDSLTYSTVAEQMRAFVVMSLRPWLVAIEQAFTGSVLMTDPNTYALFELDALLRGDPKSRAEFYASGIEHGWLDAAEVRDLEDLPRRQEATAYAA